MKFTMFGLLMLASACGGGGGGGPCDDLARCCPSLSGPERTLCDQAVMNGRTTGMSSGCQMTLDPLVATGTCRSSTDAGMNCTSMGTACADHSECCAGLFCAGPTGGATTCVMCAQTGWQCISDASCCSGLSCSGGMCMQL